MKNVISINPATGESVGEYERISIDEVQEKSYQAHKAFLKWKDVGFSERKRLMLRLADLFEAHKEEYARLSVSEMGKPIGQARKEIEKCVQICRYYAEQTESFLADEIVETEAHKSYVTTMPLGVVLAVMPWNFPFYQVVRFAAPALMTGNVGVLKHASNVQGCAGKLQEIFDEAGFPAGVFTNLNMAAKDVTELIANPVVVAVTLTGSDSAGRSVAAAAGKNLKKTVMELGGSDAYIVLDDADMNVATDLALLGRLQNNGQTCIAAKRFIVLSSIYDKFLSLFKEKMEKAKMGNPMDEDNYYGPMARVDLRDELHNQVQTTIAQGGRLICGGTIPAGLGAYYPATILADIEPGMEAFDEELFGPAASVIRAENEDEAIQLANASRFGLGSGVITGNRERGEKIARQLEAGSSYVNTLVASDPRMPFGGIKESGYGRELSGYGIREFVNTKSIWIK